MFVKWIEPNCINREHEATRPEASGIAGRVLRPRYTLCLNGACRTRKWCPITQQRQRWATPGGCSIPEAASPLLSCWSLGGAWVHRLVGRWLRSRGGLGVQRRGQREGGMDGEWGVTWGHQISLWTVGWGPCCWSSLGGRGKRRRSEFDLRLPRDSQGGCPRGTGGWKGNTGWKFPEENHGAGAQRAGG